MGFFVIAILALMALLVLGYYSIYMEEEEVVQSETITKEPHPVDFEAFLDQITE